MGLGGVGQGERAVDDHAKFARGDASAAAALSGRILELARRLGDPETISSALQLARLAEELENPVEASSLAAERVRLARDAW